MYNLTISTIDNSNAFRYNMFLSAKIVASSKNSTKGKPVLHRSIAGFVRLINDIDRGVSHLLLFCIFIGGSATVGAIGHVSGFNAWLWTALPLNPELSEFDRAGGVAFFIGQYLMLGIAFASYGYYKWIGVRQYEAAIRAAGGHASGGLAYGLGYWAYQVNGQSACSRFAPR